MSLYRVSIMTLFVLAFGLLTAESTFAQRATTPSNTKSNARAEETRKRLERERNEKFRKTLTPAKIKAQQEGKTVVLPLIKQDISPDIDELMRIAKPIRPQDERQSRPTKIDNTFEFPDDDQIPLGPVVEAFMQETEAPTALVAGLSFEGPGQGIPGYTVTGAPPDTTMAVGPNHIVAWVNTRYMIFNKAGVPQLPAPGHAAGNVLWAGFGGVCETTNRGDPLIAYDRTANRWIFSQFAFAVSGSSPAAPYRQCFAISTGPDPAGPYHRYEYSFDTAGAGGTPSFNDYGKIGIWNDGYYMGYNMFGGSPAGSNTGAGICVYERDAMLAGTAADGLCAPITFYALGASLFPADNDGLLPPTDTTRGGWFIRTNSSGAGASLNFLRLLPNYAANTVAVSNGFGGGASSFTSLASPGTRACNGTGGTCVPQLGTTNLLDTLGSRMMYRVSYRNRAGLDSVVVSYTVDPDDGGSQVAAIRWAEIRNPLGNPADPNPANRPFIYQSSTFNPDTTNRWMGGVAMNGDGDILVGYSRSSSTINPGIGVAARQAGDPLNTLQAEIIAQAGTGSQTGTLTRWGDYTTASVDPADDRTFWFIGQYLAADGTFNWRTRIVSYSFPTGPTPTPTNTPTATPTNTPTATPTPSGGVCTASYTGPAVAVPDNVPAGVNITLPVSGVGTLTDLNFRFDTAGACDGTLGNTNAAMDHTWIGDLTFRLTPPSGSPTIAFQARRGSTRDNICLSTLDDEGGFPNISTLTSVNGQPQTGNFSPETTGQFSQLDGTNANGNWTLNVSDNAVADTGSMRRFSLVMTGTACGGGATPTPTATPTNTPTATPTNTPTATPTNTPTATPTNTPTATPTNTPTATPTATPTNTPTATPTNTPTATPTIAPTATPTNTPTATPTNTPTATPTATPTSTPTATPTNTPTATPTATPGGGAGFEGDVAPRPLGDGSMTTTDVVQLRRFAASLDTPNPATNEFQRADCAPRTTFGDSVIGAADVVQGRRYAASLDPLTPAAGPALPRPGEELAAIIGGGFMSGEAKGRSLRLRSSTARSGGDVTVGVSLDSRGTDVAAVMFTLVYDPAKLSSPVIRLSSRAPAGLVLTVNDTQPGRLTILVDSAEAIRWSEFVSVTFTVAEDASGTIPVAFDPRSLSVAGPLGDTIVMSGVEGNVRITGRPRR